MRTPLTGTLAAGLLIAGTVCAPPLRAQVPAPAVPKPKSTFTVPRTPWGDPDLQGIWSSDEEAGVPFERPLGQTKPKVDGMELELLLEEREHQRVDTAAAIFGLTAAARALVRELGRKSARTSIVVDPADGRVPALTREAQARQARRPNAMGSFGAGPFERPEDFSLYDRCITRGLPAVHASGDLQQQHPHRAVAGLCGADARDDSRDARRAAGRAAVCARTPSAAISAIRAGWWDGDTLVIETRNFSDKTNYRGAGAHLRLVERFRRTQKGLRYEVTVDDRHTFTRPWTAALNLKPGRGLFEYACHEGNYAMRNMLSAARAAEAGKRPSNPAGLPECEVPGTL
jgi:hypothetical protein